MSCIGTKNSEKSPCFNFSVVVIYFLLVLSLLLSVFSLCMSIYAVSKEKSNDDETMINNIVIEN